MRSRLYASGLWMPHQLRRLGQVVRHHPSRAMEEDVPSLAEISEFLMPGGGVADGSL